ncbi:hypothetical protein ACJMK2_029333 [Sinanodonta woodiana]|uniref:Integrase catalytic domain-containing protein n=1 Tax=Sinanodonta woodiana TaxID=1069815 RepID=A0ABD3XC58_SINWO
MLSAYVSNHQRDWDEYVPLVMMAYRSSVHERTGTTPVLMTFGREITLPIDIVFDDPEKQSSESQKYKTDYAIELKERLNEIYELSRKKMQLSVENMKMNHDLRVNLHNYTIGDKVWYFDHKRIYFGV